MTETVTGIALRDTVTGRTWLGGTIHYDLFERAQCELGAVMLDRLTPGFMTSASRFVDYREAIRIDERIRFRLTPPSANLRLG